MNTTSPTQDVLKQAMERMDEAFAKFRQEIAQLKSKQTDLIQKTLQEKERQQIQSILDELKPKS